MARSSALRNVAGNVFEVILLSTFRAEIRRHRCRKEKATFAAFPVGQTTLGTDISLELTTGCVPTVCTYPPLLFVLHFIFSFLFAAVIPREGRCILT